MPREVVDTHDQAGAEELPPLIVREPLERWLDERGLGSGRVEPERIGEGHSNITYLLHRDGESRLVLRRPPRPPLPPSAHDVLREARLLSAIQDTAVRVPPVLGTCDDESVLGVPFYVMERVDGTVITSEVPSPLDVPQEHGRIAAELVDALVEMHSIDWRACGLEGFGKPTGYLERQLRRFNGLWEHNKTRELPVVTEVGDWLGRNLPESPEATIVHGDYRLGNTMFRHDAPASLVAIFDWELATIGDPLADIGYLTATWSRPDDIQETMFDRFTVTQGEGFSSRDELVVLYEERSGRRVPDVRWYQALALWKAAVFMEGNYKRFMAGTTDDSWLGAFDEGVPQLAAAARQLTELPAPRT